MMFNEANLQTLFMRMRCKGTKKIWIFSMLRASGGEKIWFLCYYAIKMARYNWQTGNSDVRETRNSVINASEICAKELWHDDCIFPKRKMAETAFLALLHTEWCTKRCFCVLTIRSECGNKDKQSTFFVFKNVQIVLR